MGGTARQGVPSSVSCPHPILGLSIDNSWVTDILASESRRLRMQNVDVQLLDSQCHWIVPYLQLTVSHMCCSSYVVKLFSAVSRRRHQRVFFAGIPSLLRNLRKSWHTTANTKYCFLSYLLNAKFNFFKSPIYSQLFDILYFKINYFLASPTSMAVFLLS